MNCERTHISIATWFGRLIDPHTSRIDSVRSLPIESQRVPFCWLLAIVATCLARQTGANLLGSEQIFNLSVAGLSLPCGQTSVHCSPIYMLPLKLPSTQHVHQSRAGLTGPVAGLSSLALCGETSDSFVQSQFTQHLECIWAAVKGPFRL